MKTNAILILAACLFVTQAVFAQTGMVFFHGSWDEAVSKAKEENKLLFVDAYTAWCGPCKRMSSDVFPTANVGAFYNANFVNYKLDMEKGDGPKVARDFAVKAYPTYLFVDGNGKLSHRGLGYLPEPEFLQLGREALDPSKNLGTAAAQAADSKDPKVLQAFAEKSLTLGDNSHIAPAEKFLATQTDWSKPEIMTFIYRMTTSANTSLFKHIVQHRADFEKLLGEKEYVHFVDGHINDLLSSTQELGTIAELDSILLWTYPQDATRLSKFHRTTWARQRGDREGYSKAAVEYFSNYKASADELVGAVWTVYESIENPETLKFATKWAKKAVKMDKAYYSLEALARIYHKQGNNKKALKAARKAIAIAKANEEDASGAQELLLLMGEK
jgi:thioredoxin-related protein